MAGMFGNMVGALGNMGFPSPPPSNVFGQAANWLTQAGNMAGRAGNYQPQQVQGRGYQAATVGAPQLANANLQQYQNPYTSQVINRSLGDLNRARQMALNDVGAQATAAGAFGGSRLGVAEGVTNGQFAQQAGDMAAGLRSQGFQNAQNAAQFDIGNRIGAGQFNANAQNAASQFGAQQGYNAQVQNQGAGLQAAGLGLNAAGSLQNNANLGFGFGQQAQQMQQQAGAQQQGIMQQLINAAQGQYGQFTGQPMQNLQALIAAMGGSNIGNAGTTTQTNSPGLFGILQSLAGL